MADMGRDQDAAHAVGRPAQPSSANSRPSARRIGCRRVLALTAVVLMAACRDGSPSADTSALVPAGSDLGGDFIVPESTRLIGSRFPGLDDGSWSALLLVDGDPFVIMEDLIDQAEASSLAVGTSDNRGLACNVHAETLLECDLYAEGDSPPRTYSFGLRWGNDAGASYSHILVRRESRTYDFEMPPVDDFANDPPQRPAIDLPPAPEGVDDWVAPDVGQEVAVTPSWFERTVVDLESGSSVVAPPGPAWCGTGGYTAVLRLDDGAAATDVVARYAGQFEDFGFVGTTSTGFFEEAPYVAARYGAAGGGELEAVALGDRPKLLLLSRCND